MKDTTFVLPPMTKEINTRVSDLQMSKPVVFYRIFASDIIVWPTQVLSVLTTSEMVESLTTMVMCSKLTKSVL